MKECRKCERMRRIAKKKMRENKKGDEKNRIRIRIYETYARDDLTIFTLEIEIEFVYHVRKGIRFRYNWHLFFILALISILFNLLHI